MVLSLLEVIGCQLELEPVRKIGDLLRTDAAFYRVGGLVTAAAAAGLATVSAGRAFAIGLKIQFVLFDLSVREGHLRIVEAILLVLLYRGTGADHHDRQQTGDE